MPDSRFRSVRAALLAGASTLVVLACGDGAGPARVEPYDWQLLIPFDSAGFQIDTLTFHWPPASVPVTIWVENQSGLPGHVSAGIALWRAAFPGGAWNAMISADSNTADIIVRHLPAGSAPGAVHRATRRLSCEGATDVDTAATRFQLRLPMRVYVYPSVPGAPDINQCLAIATAHELGHSLGLLQHSPDPADLMYATPNATTPTDRDLASARAAYQATADMQPVRP